MGVLEFLVTFYPINTALVVFSSDLKMDPLNLYPTYRYLVMGGAFSELGYVGLFVIKCDTLYRPVLS